MNINTEIVNIKAKITELNDSVKVSVNIKDEDISNIIPVIKDKSKDKSKDTSKDKSKDTSNYIVNQHQYKQNYLNYKRNLNKKKHEVEVLNNTDELLLSIGQNDYKKTWNRLDNYQKKLKLKEYIYTLDSTLEIKEQYISTFNREINEKKFNNKNFKYDINNMKIIMIKNLDNE